MHAPCRHSVPVRFATLCRLAPLALLAVLALCPLPTPAHAQGLAQDQASDQAPGQASGQALQAAQFLHASTADLPEMLRRGQVRVLVTPSRTNFYMAPDGSFRGLEHDLALLLEKSLNKGRRKGEARVSVLFVPVLLDELIPALLEGRGDIAAAGLTITPVREQLVAFTEPYFRDVRDVLVTRTDAPPIKSRYELSGRVLHVAAGSSHAEHLAMLARDFERRGLPPMTVVEADHALDVENLLEMLSAGLVDNVLADEHVARIWAGVLPGLAVFPQAQATHGGRIAWAVRKDNPQLLAAANAALRQGATRQAALFQKRFQKSLAGSNWLKNPFLSPKTAQYVPEFKRRSEEYGFDWLHLMAQGFQESGLDNSARSHMGAVGVMQVLPSTGASLGFRDIRPAPENIHAGTRYMGRLRDQEIGPDGLDEEQRFYFALASYNAGPARIRRLREQARAQGLDPDIWFGSVERAALQSGLQATVAYVRNVRAYAIAYSLSYDIHRKRARAAGR